jgi:hypothetical protein
MRLVASAAVGCVSVTVWGVGWGVGWVCASGEACVCGMEATAHLHTGEAHVSRTCPQQRIVGRWNAPFVRGTVQGGHVEAGLGPWQPSASGGGAGGGGRGAQALGDGLGLSEVVPGAGAQAPGEAEGGRGGRPAPGVPYEVPSDADLASLLTRLGLDHLLTAGEGLDQTREWDAVLSVGEQQRIAFARLLTHRCGHF